MKPSLVLLLLAPLGLVAAGAARPSVAGTWDCVATDVRGTQTLWSLTVKEDGQKLAATLRSSDGYDLPLADVKAEDNRFSFRAQVNETEAIEVVLMVDGDRMEGRWGGTTAGAGLFKATRAGSVNVSGLWTGEWEISPDGNPGGPHRMVLKQEGDQVTGTGGPGEDRQFAISRGKFAAGKLTFDIVIPSGPRFAFDFTVSGNTMWGSAVMTGAGETRQFKLSASRATVSR